MIFIAIDIEIGDTKNCIDPQPCRFLLAAAGGLVLHMAPCTGRAEVMTFQMKLVLARQKLW
jgi:hypothetical protein